MTVKECYESAISFLPEKPEENPELQKFIISWCNVLLAESLSFENAARKAKGVPEKEIPPIVTSMEEEIPYNENLVRAAFPYGMARWAFRENDDIAASHEYYNLYTNALEEATPVIFTDIEDIYLN